MTTATAATGSVQLHVHELARAPDVRDRDAIDEAGEERIRVEHARPPGRRLVTHLEQIGAGGEVVVDQILWKQ